MNQDPASSEEILDFLRTTNCVFRVPNKYRPDSGHWMALIDGVPYSVRDVVKITKASGPTVTHRFRQAFAGKIAPADILNNVLPRKTMKKQKGRVRAQAEDLSSHWRQALCQRW